MNHIPTEQNSARQIQRLAAQRQLYATAKTVFGWQALLSGPVAVILAFLIMQFPETKGYVALWGILLSLCDVGWLTPWQKRLRSIAAKVQEAFDCDVLGLDWNDLKTDHRPDPELVREQADKYKRQAGSMPPLTNWYAPVVGSLPLHIARVACQRSNCWWDAKQRRCYATSVIVVLMAILISVLFLTMRGGFTIEKFVLNVAAPLSPVVLLGIRQFIEQRETASRLDKLKEHAEQLWKDALDGKPDSEVSVQSRRMQDEILENRKRSPLVFDWIFKRLRNRYEIQVNHGVAELVTEAEQRMKLVGDYAQPANRT